MVEALYIQVKGIVQGVGFRPFVYRMAKKYLVNGWVLNATDGVFIHAEAESKLLDEFVMELSENPPSASKVAEISLDEVPLEGFDSFEIRFSDAGAVEKTTLVSPDLATCGDCMRELFNPNDRRFRYPFINCTNCGPRFTIIEELPYDRKHTSMKEFSFCERCAHEYADPLDRRFHAQPDACFVCGPHLSWREHEAGVIDEPLGAIVWGAARGESDALLARAVRLLLAGGIVAVKGLGGFHLVCDASNEQALALLRTRKRREGKAFAVMMASVHAARKVCWVSNAEADMLESTQRPIVLLRKRLQDGFAAGLADKLPELGVMLPYTPLQHLLLHDFMEAGGGGMLVMTSGNVHDEPIVTNDDDAYVRLFGIADAFLGHNRNICTRYDDSVVRLINTGSAGEAVQFLRRARGYAPLPVPLACQPAEQLDAAASCGTQSCHAGDSLRTEVRGASVSEPILGTTESLADFGGPASAGESALLAGVGGPASGSEPTSLADFGGPASGSEPAPLADFGGPASGSESTKLADFGGPASGSDPTSLAGVGKTRGFSVFATGPEQKNTFALSRENEVFVSQHIGDMENAETYDAWLATKARYESLFEITPTQVACDLHPEYLSSKWAHAQTLPVVEVQHHHAHVVSAMAEHGLAGPVCGIAFDGTGYGVDGRIWGGEVLLSNLSAFERFANFAYVPMPGGAAAVKNPLRQAYGVLWAFDLLDHPAAAGLISALGAQAGVCEQMIEQGINTPMTSSVGRLFDAASALLGLCDKPAYEGEPAILLEAAISPPAPSSSRDTGATALSPDEEACVPDPTCVVKEPGSYSISVVKNTATAQSTAQDTSVVLFDAAPAFASLLDDKQAGVSVSIIARRFHNAFVGAIVDAAQLVRNVFDINIVVLSGGVFMNRYLIEHSLQQLDEAGFTVAINRDLPPNDGCISFGQAVVACATNEHAHSHNHSTGEPSA